MPGHHGRPEIQVSVPRPPPHPISLKGSNRVLWQQASPNFGYHPAILIVFGWIRSLALFEEPHGTAFGQVLFLQLFWVWCMGYALVVGSNDGAHASGSFPRGKQTMHRISWRHAEAESRQGDWLLVSSFFGTKCASLRQRGRLSRYKETDEEVLGNRARWGTEICGVLRDAETVGELHDK